MTRKKVKTVNPKTTAQKLHEASATKAGRELVKALTGLQDESKRWSSIPPPVMGSSGKGWHEHEPFLVCPKKYHLSTVWGIRKPQWQTPDALGVGALFHAGRGHWYEAGFPMGAAYERALHDYVEAAALAMELPVREDAITRTKRYLGQYIAYWGVRAKPKVIGAEYKLSGRIAGLDSDRTARLDDVSEYPEANFKLALGECKTTSTTVKDCVQEYELHGQPMKQELLWRVSPEGEKKHGPAEFVLLDVIVKGYGKEDCSFGRVAIRIYPFSRDWYAKELGRSITAASHLTPETKDVRRNITSCTKHYGRMRVDCAFKPLCRQGPSASTAYVDRQGVSLSKYINREGAKPWD